MYELLFDIVVITETWLNDTITSAELFPLDYSIIRCDRRFGEVGRSVGGGVLVALRSNIDFETVDVAHITDLVPLIDFVLCKCYFGRSTYYLAGIYIPPDVTSDYFLMHWRLLC